MDDAFGPGSARMLRAAADLPQVTLGTTHGTPSLKVGKKLMARMREPDVLAFYCRDEAEKFGLIDAAPELYFTTPHYDGYAMVLARLSLISDAELKHRLLIAWESRATATLRKQAAL